MAATQKPETFMLSTEAQQALPHDAQVALQQVDNCMYDYVLMCDFIDRTRSGAHSGPLTDTLVCYHTFCSEILPYFCARRLAAGSVHSKISATNR